MQAQLTPIKKKPTTASLFDVDGTVLAALIALVVVALTFSFALSMPQPREHLAHHLNLFLLTKYHHYDTFWQRMAHLAMLGVLAPLCLAGPKLLTVWQSMSKRDRLRQSAYGIIAALIATLILVSGKILLENLLYSIVGTFITLAAFHLWGKQMRGRLVSAALMVVLLSLFAVATVPGFFSKPDLSWVDAEALVNIDQHYTHVVGQGDRIAAGHRLFEQIKPAYGCLMPVLTGAWETRFGSLDFGAIVQIMRVMQAVFLAIAAFLYFRFAHNQIVPALCAWAMLLPLEHFNNFGLWIVNNSPWRYMALPVVVLVIYLSRKCNPPWLYYLLGTISGSAVVFNFETGIALSVGILAYVHFRYCAVIPWPSIKRFVPFVTLFSLGFLSALALFLAVYYLLLGHVPNLMSIGSVVDATKTVVTTGFSGLKIFFLPIVAWMLVHSIFVLLRITFKSSEPLDFADSFRGFVATTILVWFAYWFNEPEKRYLPSYIFLYGFLFIDLVRFVLVSISRRKLARPALLAAVLALSVIIVPTTISVYKLEMLYFNWGLYAWHKQVWAILADRVAQEDRALVSGVYLEPKCAQELLRKADFIRNLKPEEPPAYLTSNSYLLPKLSGVPSVFSPRFADTFTGVFTEGDCQELVQRIVLGHYPKLYFDDPKGLFIGSKSYIEYYTWLKGQISSHYHKAAVSDGWEIWTRLGDY